jgi:hypothetical protein
VAVTKKLRVQSHNFSNETSVQIGLQAIEGNFSANGVVTNDEAAELPVGQIVTVTIEPA